jgi:hypothetical protein
MAALLIEGDVRRVEKGCRVKESRQRVKRTGSAGKIFQNVVEVNKYFSRGGFAGHAKKREVG